VERIDVGGYDFNGLHELLAAKGFKKASTPEEAAEEGSQDDEDANQEL
jgi:hypothetical protein